MTNSVPLYQPGQELIALLCSVFWVGIGPLQPFCCGTWLRSWRVRVKEETAPSSLVIRQVRISGASSCFDGADLSLLWCKWPCWEHRVYFSCQAEPVDVKWVLQSPGWQIRPNGEVMLAASLVMMQCTEIWVLVLDWPSNSFFRKKQVNILKKRVLLPVPPLIQKYVMCARSKTTNFVSCTIPHISL